MPSTDVQIINNGLSKIAGNRISQISPPQTALERFMAVGYPKWKRYEIAKRRWNFALEPQYRFTLSEELTHGNFKYRFRLPAECLRPLRDDSSDWKQYGRYLHSNYPQLSVDLLMNRDEEDFDVLFEEVLACKVAYESCEFVTQSNSKKATALQEYKDAVVEAAKANAFVTGAEDIQDNDATFSWVADRW